MTAPKVVLVRQNPAAPTAEATGLLRSLTVQHRHFPNPAALGASRIIAHAV